MVAVDADALWVETIRQSTCGACTAQKGCGHGLLNRVGAGKRGYIRVLPGQVDPGACKVNDRVTIAIPEEVILRGSMIVYMLPLLVMLVLAGLASSLWPDVGDRAALMGAGLGFAFGVALVRWHAWRHHDDHNLQPILLWVGADDQRTVDVC